MSDTVLSVKNLSISFKNNSDSKTVLINSNFKIKRGTTLSLVGESGSGKSITSLALVSLLPLNASIAGSINFNGEELIGLSEIELQKIRGNKISFIYLVNFMFHVMFPKILNLETPPSGKIFNFT